LGECGFPAFGLVGCRLGLPALVLLALQSGQGGALVADVSAKGAEQAVFAFEVEDRGNGLSPTLLSEMNGRLRTAPLFAEMANTQQLGLFVAGRLSAEPGLPGRPRIPVTLRACAYGGLSAVVTIPQTLLTHHPEPSPQQAAVSPPLAPTATTPASRPVPAARSPLLSTATAEPAEPHLEP
jgi:hypothetical protein